MMKWMWSQSEAAALSSSDEKRERFCTTGRPVTKDSTNGLCGEIAMGSHLRSGWGLYCQRGFGNGLVLESPRSRHDEDD